MVITSNAFVALDKNKHKSVSVGGGDAVVVDEVLFFFLFGHHETLEMFSVNHAAINLELTEGIVNLVGSEFLPPGHQGVSEHLCVDLAVDLKGFEGPDDDIIVVRSSGHLLSEECDHLGEVDGSWGLSHHVSSITVTYRTSDTLEGGLEVGGGDDAVLVVVDDAECLLELLDLFLAEQGEDVGARLLGLLGSFVGHLV